MRKTSFGPFHDTLRRVQPSATFAINDLSRRLESEGKELYKFGFGQSPFSPPSFGVEELKRHAGRHEYTPVPGLRALREAAAKFHSQKLGVRFDWEDVLVAPGSKILIFTILQALVDIDVLLPIPSWVSYAPQADLCGYDVIRIDTSFSDKWQLASEKLDKACRERKDKTKPAVLILNYPGNPSGTTLRPRQLKTIAEIARKHKLLIISDEIYGFITHRFEHTTIAKFYPEGTIITTGLSKWCGAGGWRLGIALIPKQLGEDFLNTLIGIGSETYSSAPTPVQLAAVRAYEGDEAVENYRTHVRRILSAVGQSAAAKLRQVGVRVCSPEGGFYLYLDFGRFRQKLIKKGVNTSNELCEVILDETGVVLLPGAAFGASPSHLTARLSYVDFDGDRALTASREIRLSSDINLDFLKKYCPKVLEGVDKLVNWISQF